MLLTEQAEARATALWAACMAAGHGDKVPDPAAAREEFLATLRAEPVVIDSVDRELRDILGVR